MTDTKFDAIAYMSEKEDTVMNEVNDADEGVGEVSAEVTGKAILSLLFCVSQDNPAYAELPSPEAVKTSLKMELEAAHQAAMAAIDAM